MGRRGPIPKPTVLEIAEGRPGKRPTNQSEPQPAAVDPKLPSHLDKDARKEWRELLPILRRMRVVTEADYMVLSNLCQDFSTLKAAQTKLSETGILIKGRYGQPVVNPLLRVVNEKTASVNSACREFGLTPSARSRIRMEPDSKEDSIAASLNRPDTEMEELRNNRILGNLPN
ncbi:MAG: phage terminase small subunit P27 family [Acidobacteriota bacterium]|nr:phage terminase small subunit P27 family [Acidobacteriota bacterium]